jgi:hypothetical protein
MVFQTKKAFWKTENSGSRRLQDFKTLLSGDSRTREAEAFGRPYHRI